MTREGAGLLALAKETLHQYEKLESYYRSGNKETVVMSIAVPRASYVADAFVNTVNQLKISDSIELDFVETNSITVISNITDRNFDLGIIRFPDIYKDYYLSLLKVKGLSYQTVLRFTYMVVMSQSHPLAYRQKLTVNMLRDYVEIVHGDISLPGEHRVDYGATHISAKRIYVYERGSQFNLLESSPVTFMQVSPIPQKILDELHLVQLPLEDGTGPMQDLLVYHKSHRFTQPEKLFCEQLQKVAEPLQKMYHQVPTENS